MDIAKETTDIFDQNVYQFITNDVLPLRKLDPGFFWAELSSIIKEFTAENKKLLGIRSEIQSRINEWHRDRKNQIYQQSEYQDFLKNIGYLCEETDDFSITTSNLDAEICRTAAPQLVVPLKNPRFALNAANARWGSLYDAVYGSDLIPNTGKYTAHQSYNPERGARVITYGRNFLDEHFPLHQASHHDVISYMVYYNHLMVMFKDGSRSWLEKPSQFVALAGRKSDPESIVLKNNGLHIEIQFDKKGNIGRYDRAGIQDIHVEAALTTIMDCEDSVSAVDAQDKLELYKNWLGLILGNLTVNFEKNGQTITRTLNRDREFTRADGGGYTLPGRSLMLIRIVGDLMESDIYQDAKGQFAPESILDAVFTSLIASLDLIDAGTYRNSRNGSIYIVKPKMHGPDEVDFTCRLFSRIETLLHLPKHTLKIGIMDEERRTTVNLKACIYAARERVFFINTGFLDRTGDEIHTSMEAGAFYPKAALKEQAWIKAYEERNVALGLACGFAGKAQIGKGMWPKPDALKDMMESKLSQPKQGASTAWVPSPTAAVLHAIHYHKVNVIQVQSKIAKSITSKTIQKNLDNILAIPIMPEDSGLNIQDIHNELANNIQSILGYVVRWVALGIGCSKVPDIQQVALMEDRATLRISSQHIANWLRHRICSKKQVKQIMMQMADIVDKQNSKTPAYIPLLVNNKKSIAFQAAEALIFEGVSQANGYTEPLLHKFRLDAKR